MFVRLIAYIFIFGLFFTVSYTRAEQSPTIRVAVSSNFRLPMMALTKRFESRERVRVKLAFASSGKFVAQIVNGAPFDAFFSADQASPLALLQRGIGEPKSRFTYALGGLVLWSSKHDYVDLQGRVLEHGDYRNLALANPKFAPYGRAAMEVLADLDPEGRLSHKFVFGENIAQTYQFIQSGNAGLGFVARSQVLHDGKIVRGSGWIVPYSLHTEIKQDAILLAARGTRQFELAQKLLHFTQHHEEAAALIHRYGYKTVH